ncbi:MAG: pyridoxal-phosphate dependent enzyme [Gammaproteobacteria bacterium]|nr:pyridoxal-phosphate dependent enzyme [Gammaproteobacteria bacterium]
MANSNRPLHVVTPIIQSMPLQKLTGQSIFLKMECYQPVGSFKIRGLGRLAQHYVAQGYKQLISSSGGNAGVAAAYIGWRLGVKVKVFLPTTSNALFVDAIKRYGAEVVVTGDVWDEANAAALRSLESEHAGFIPPFDHPLIWAGHATLIDEVAAEGIRPEAIVVAVGGGGLACGVITGLHNFGWYDIPVFTAETTGTASFKASMDAGELITLPKVSGIATSLAAKRVTQRLFDFSKQHQIIPLAVSDEDTIMACRSFLNDHRVLLEPASGAPLSLVYNKHPALSEYKSILVIVCGGIGMSLEKLIEFTL